MGLGLVIPTTGTRSSGFTCTSGLALGAGTETLMGLGVTGFMLLSSTKTGLVIAGTGSG